DLSVPLITCSAGAKRSGSLTDGRTKLNAVTVPLRYVFLQHRAWERHQYLNMPEKCYEKENGYVDIARQAQMRQVQSMTSSKICAGRSRRGGQQRNSSHG